jgi:hypothetical protein
MAQRTPFPIVTPLLNDVTIVADRVENTASNGYYTVSCVCCLVVTLILLLVAQPLASNGGFSGSPIHTLGKYDTIWYNIQMYHQP